MRESRSIAMAASLGVALLMLAGKLTAYAITGSTAILSDAVESVVHIIATGMAAYSLWLSRQSACAKHPYGHGKIAYFSAGFEGALILTAAAFIFWSSGTALVRGSELQELHIGVFVTAFLAAVNLVLGLFLVRVGRRKNDLILIANGKHVLTDMWTSAGVVVGILIVWVTQVPWLDPLVAILVGGNILIGAVSLIRKSVQGLLDEADAAQTERLLACLERSVADGLLVEFHQLRHRQANDVMWVEVHMLLPGHLATGKAHRRVTRIENEIRGLFPDFQVQVTSHVEPARHERAHPGGHDGMVDPYTEEEADATAAEGLPCDGFVPDSCDQADRRPEPPKKRPYVDRPRNPGDSDDRDGVL